MMSQSYKFYLVNLLSALMIILLSACSSSRLAQNNTGPDVRATVESYIKAMNEEDIKMLDHLYADDFMSYSPLYKSSKEELLKSLQNGFKAQDNKVQGNITEITNGSAVATVHLNWMIIAANKEIIFAQNLLQVWKKEKTSWKLHRILFYIPGKIPELKDFDF